MLGHLLPFQFHYFLKNSRALFFYWSYERGERFATSWIYDFSRSRMRTRSWLRLSLRSLSPDQLARYS